jgi:signal transduction histidine kinase
MLRRIGARPAAEPLAEDARVLRALDPLLAQTMRAARGSSGAVRAYASLITDACGSGSNPGHWAAKIERSALELDEFVARQGTLRICDGERPTELRWAEVLSRVVSHCGVFGRCTIEVTDRTRGPFRQRAELAGRVLFHVVRNAVEATPRGGLVRVRADELSVAGARAVHIRISDEGPGPGDPAAADAMWRPFVTTKSGHAGLGLAYASVCAGLLGAVQAVRCESPGLTFHSLIFEEGELSW